MVEVIDNGSAPRLVVFDLDGTLYPRELYTGLILDVIGAMFVELRGDPPEQAEAKVAELRELMRTEWSSTSTTSFVLANGIDVDEWRAYREAHLSIVDGVRPDERVVRELERLRAVVPIALLTNNTAGAAEAILDRIGVGVAGFTGVVSADDVGGRPKPDPGAFRVLLERFDVDAREVWGVGDRYDIDVRPLRELGGAGITVDGPADLPEAVDFLVGRAS
ncbi:FMN phosphatase YigB (HAD superfamily) [Saccharothrix saharensis]|uniref:FMN phosphatase YigB (HAD superfamily) n=1 Tax=Saccharothrix saharensis TaxID=571190 RepID=A0A543JA39_9PSEU|nr:HAD family hydrolase [Saccharothrix saharensis]TQM79676.1 FMN phosphatase YigB (HAD superfamily) [Saccharothrix saharensis]